MEFITNNPNIPVSMFNGQPMNVYQNPQQYFNFFDTKKKLYYFIIHSLTKSNSIYTQSTNGSGEPINGSFISCSYSSNNGKFRFTFVEALKIDKMSDVFLDNMTAQMFF